MGVTVGHNVGFCECQLSMCFWVCQCVRKGMNVKKEEENKEENKKLDRNPKLWTVSLDNVMLEWSALGIWGTSVSA